MVDWLRSREDCLPQVIKANTIQDNSGGIIRGVLFARPRAVAVQCSHLSMVRGTARARATNLSELKAGGCLPNLLLIRVLRKLSSTTSRSIMLRIVPRRLVRWLRHSVRRCSHHNESCKQGPT